MDEYIPGSLTKSRLGTTRYEPGQFAKGIATGEYVPGSYITSARRADLKSANGLYNLAVSKGLKNDADRLLQSQSGEKNEFFSGGFISDIFDVLNMGSYGVVGLLKGKSFLEGIKNRESFASEDALGSSGLPGVIMGTILDIAVDPLTYVAPYTVAKKIPVIGKAVQLGKEATFGKAVTKAIEGTNETYQAIEGGTRAGKYLAQKLSWMSGADPIFRETFERGLKNTAISTSQVADMGRAVAKISPDMAKQILSKDETGRFFRTPLEKVTLKGDDLIAVTNLYNRIDSLGKEAVDLGLLSKTKYEENIGKYLKNAYDEYELAKKNLFGVSRVGVKGIKKRVEELTPEKMKELGQIDNPAYLLFKSAFDLAKDVENAKLFKEVSERFGTTVAQDGFTKLPDGTRLGSLAGKYVPNHMADYLNEIIKPAGNQLARQTVANFKFFKVVMNPATHARNIMSNKILNYWKLGMNPLDPRVIKSDLIAVKEIASGGGKWTDEAKKYGYNLDTFASQELRGLLDDPQMKPWLNSLGKNALAIKKKLGDMYQSEENWAKLSAFIYQRKKGLKAEEAWKAAESATFNYAQVTPFIRKLREALFGFPFITFTVKATGLAAETAMKAPHRISVLGKIKNSIEKLSDTEEYERERELEPSWVKDGFYVKLPIKDAQGRSAYFDLTYIIPFGDLISGNFFERPISRDTGLPENVGTALMQKSPALSLIRELSRNQDFYGNRIWKDSDTTDKQMTDIMRHLSKAYLPPLVADQIPGGYNDKNERDIRGFVGTVLDPATEENQKRNLMQEIFRNVGAKIQPIDADIQEKYQEWNKQKALKKLLQERGVIKEMDIIYQPKK